MPSSYERTNRCGRAFINSHIFLYVGIGERCVYMDDGEHVSRRFFVVVVVVICVSIFRCGIGADSVAMLFVSFHSVEPHDPIACGDNKKSERNIRKCLECFSR